MTYIQLIKDAGFRVFVRPHCQAPITYCFYTDGTKIGYAQWSGCRAQVSTVHVPCRKCGTGFVYADEITVETVKGALNCHAPHWASDWDRAAVKKYRDFDAYLKASKFNSGLVEV
jgi:hypothetical protein